MTAAALTLTTDSPDATRDLGRRLGQIVEPGTCIALIGPLGAGKTEFVKGLAVGIGVPADVAVTSPTFILINEYAGRVPMFHMDAYRLSGPAALDGLGFDEIRDAAGLLVVEWAERLEPYMPDDRLAVHFEHINGQRRRLRWRPTGPNARRLLDALPGSA